ncbi:hypothetical protein [Herbaspirillum aquaticum]|uniref:hypothetical protein n=1 Tax=Herbaspirillum aquaticum TaxID=568783 RepID=UPI003D7A4A6D
MKERPILFSAPMVRAILAGDKTQTRRIAKDVRHPDLGNVYAPGALVLEREPQHVIERACPYGRPGDRLWVRETWGYNPDHPGMPWHACYRADPGMEYDGIKWKPSIHMPRAACRIKLEITGVRVERLQDISDFDAEDEGTRIWAAEVQKNGNKFSSIRSAWQAMWESINGSDSWQANPWVWVVEFRRIA